jgi:hypothetical protein
MTGVANGKAFHPARAPLPEHRQPAGSRYLFLKTRFFCLWQNPPRLLHDKETVVPKIGPIFRGPPPLPTTQTVVHDGTGPET